MKYQDRFWLSDDLEGARSFGNFITVHISTRRNGLLPSSRSIYSRGLSHLRRGT